MLQSDYISLTEERDNLVEDRNSIYDVRYEEGYDAGYTQGIMDSAGTGYNIRDPTYQEALQFISIDPTEKNQYDAQNYTCFNFVADFKNNAFNAGYRCGYVAMEFPDSAHAIVCFHTTDRGLILIAKSKMFSS